MGVPVHMGKSSWYCRLHFSSRRHRFLARCTALLVSLTKVARRSVVRRQSLYTARNCRTAGFRTQGQHQRRVCAVRGIIPVPAFDERKFFHANRSVFLIAYVRTLAVDGVRLPKSPHTRTSHLPVCICPFALAVSIHVRPARRPVPHTNGLVTTSTRQQPPRRAIWLVIGSRP